MGLPGRCAVLAVEPWFWAVRNRAVEHLGMFPMRTTEPHWLAELVAVYVDEMKAVVKARGS